MELFQDRASTSRDDQASVSRGTTLTVAERARALIIGLRYGLPWYYFAR
jgi:hypothetical protein